VHAYLLAAAKLYAVAALPSSFSSELALQLLYAHDFDVAAATHSMATAIGVDKLLVPDAPVSANTSLINGRKGLRVSLNLSLRHMSANVSRDQPEGGFVRATRSRTGALDAPVQQSPWSDAEQDALTEGMRRDGKDLHTIWRRNLKMSRTYYQVVEFFYSAKGQRIKAMVMAERAAAEERKAAAEAAAAAEKGQKHGGNGATLSHGAGGSTDSLSPGGLLKKPKGRKPASEAKEEAPPRSRPAGKRSRPVGEDGRPVAKQAKRFGSRVFANVSVRGAESEVRLRLRVKRVDLRKYEPASFFEDPAPVKQEAAAAPPPAVAGPPPVPMVKGIGARCKVLSGGHIKPVTTSVTTLRTTLCNHRCSREATSSSTSTSSSRAGRARARRCSAPTACPSRRGRASPRGRRRRACSSRRRPRRGPTRGPATTTAPTR